MPGNVAGPTRHAKRPAPRTTCMLRGFFRTRVRLGDACGCPDEEADTVQHPHSAMQGHAGFSDIPRSRR